MRVILVYNDFLSSLMFRKGPTMANTFTLLGGSFLLILGALWWVLHR